MLTIINKAGEAYFNPPGLFVTTGNQYNEWTSNDAWVGKYLIAYFAKPPMPIETYNTKEEAYKHLKFITDYIKSKPTDTNITYDMSEN